MNISATMEFQARVNQTGAKIDQMYESVAQYIDKYTIHLNFILQLISKLESYKLGLTIEKIQEKVTNPQVLSIINSMNSLFTTECAKIISDKYINTFKDYHNKVLKQIQILAEDFKKLEQKFIYLQRMEIQNPQRPKLLDDIIAKMRSLNEKLSREIKFYSYDPQLFFDNPDQKVRAIKNTIDSHIQKVLSNLI